ncbi:dTDP-4-dehydrorhamnose 3,5-epimerase [Alkalimarinus coralli]|uniref:dTDP-4-dehydrorhamnose 3,5-epimerase n=1 Tax=Alkalimarinus coralli TaxID=2935863 RepID=UPI00202B927E|nr:dTDP-4-dehydrorhamnose 3,5-epimerase [Alkalimarinus coralli]
MKVTKTKLDGCVIIEPNVFGDARGFFKETFQVERYREAGLTLPFVQDNHSRSSQGVLRGLHFQKTKPQGKLVSCSQGEVFDVAVDLRPNSPTYGQWEGIILTGDNHQQFYVPPGFAHGFVVLSDTADFQYKCTDYYDPSDEGGIIWNDPDVGIKWPLGDIEPALSEKDMKLPRLNDINQ